jgi:hypothetical protein
MQRLVLTLAALTIAACGGNPFENTLERSAEPRPSSGGFGHDSGVPVTRP